jgi:membrane protein YdbS with pleckstrin-like domain
MPIPARLLNEGEDVVVDVRPHAWTLAGPLALAGLAVAAAALGAAYGVPPLAAWALVAVMAAALLHLLGRWLRWRSTSLVVTTERIVARRGVLARTGREIPMGQLADVSYRQSLLGRVIGAGDLLVSSSGSDGVEVFADLPHPEEIERDVHAVLPARSGRTGGGLSLPEQLEKLDELRRRGVLSDAEFAATKARLLGGR